MREIDILVVSDLHLGTFGCRAQEFGRYLNSVQPKMIILNGDIIDIWQFKKNYFPASHMKVVRQLLKMASSIPVYYITGNHDEALRQYSDFSIGNLHLVDQLEIEVNGNKYWFFHGDIFDVSIQSAKWLAKLGGASYDMLIRLNNVVNWFLIKTGREKMSFSKRIKNSVKHAVKYISDFEESAAEFAIQKGVDYVCCGHIHQPQIRQIYNGEGEVNYLNSGDWIENLTALEYSNNQWSMYTYDEEQYQIDEIVDKWKLERSLLGA